MKVYVMRHGTTLWNEKGITQGRSNNKLSVHGKNLTKEVAKKHKNSKFDVIFCSPLMRTVQTANIMNEYHNVKIIKDDRLIEVDQGIFTGRKKSDLTEKENKLKLLRPKSCGMEKFESVYDRADEFLEYLKGCDYSNVLIVTHNVNASLIDCIMKNINVDFKNKEHTVNFKNAEVRTFYI
ncbi:MAG: histidine phosphatase family protein [Clostridia bacterium]|nr:histidine phosphatase family protein [Clostridia bacterium]